ncbi:hypothetical protein JTE90_019103 [Oedothorax gibbosus]|uniref:Major facilitator superfamily (MFS) profile domain-containing protein n=1 Tax=Oedothorax gibbosus TaxID=931172 RepID=A0AAV6VA26_9ARAC|nr:hypothetical protein JTE90_019103 [Oedothorax gibbosus]
MSGPDSGRAWLVAGACWCINFVLVGLARSVAMLYVSLVEQYGITREQATLPFSIRVSLKNLAGPLIGLLGQKYGIRRVSSAGGVIAALGCFLCYFAPNIMWVTVLWGIVHGIGFGMANVIHMLIINQYFDKYRASALGLAYSGDCFGAFAFPIIIESLVENYDVKGTFLILSAILLNIVPMTLLLKKPPWLKTSAEKLLIKDEKSTNIPQELKGYDNEYCLKLDEDLTPFQEDEYCSYNPSYGHLRIPNRHNSSIQSSSSFSSHGESLINGSFRSHIKKFVPQSDSLIPVFEKELSIFPSDKDDFFSSQRLEEDDNEMVTNADSVNQQGSQATKRRRSSSISQIASELLHKVRSASFASQVVQDGFALNLGKLASELNSGSTTQSQSNTRLGDKDLDFQVFSISTGQEIVPSPGRNVSNRSSSAPLTDNVFFRKSSKPQPTILETQSSVENSDNDPPSSRVIFTRKENKELIMTVEDIKLSEAAYFSDTNPQRQLPGKQPSILKLLIQTNLKPIFVLISMSMAVFAYSFIGVGIVLIDYAGDQGISHQLAKFLVVGFSATDLLGRLVFGVVIDKKLLKMKNYVSVVMVVMGVMTASLPLNPSFNYMMVCNCLIGVAVGGIAIMFPILVNHYMDENEGAVAMGSLNFYGGILALSMAPMIGHFRDVQGSYNGVFYVFGGLVVLVGVLWQLEPLILKWQDKTKNSEHWLVVTRL